MIYYCGFSLYLRFYIKWSYTSLGLLAVLRKIPYIYKNMCHDNAHISISKRNKICWEDFSLQRTSSTQYIQTKRIPITLDKVCYVTQHKWTWPKLIWFIIPFPDVSDRHVKVNITVFWIRDTKIKHLDTPVSPIVFKF